MIGRVCWLLALVLGAPSLASAQRGADFIAQDDVEQGARTGFPGIFDTTTVARGKMVQSYPWLGVDYGLTDNWSVGTNGLLLLQNVGLSPTAFVRTRYRVFGQDRFSAVIDGSLLGTRLSIPETEEDPAQSLTTFAGILGGNARYEYSARHSFTASLHVAQLVISSKEMSRETDRASFRLSILALTHELSPNNWYSLRTTLLHAPQLSLFLDSIGSTAEIDSSGIDGSLQRTGIRVLNSFRSGRWLFSAGGIFVVGVPLPLPWLSVSRVYF